MGARARVGVREEEEKRQTERTVARAGAGHALGSGRGDEENQEGEKGDMVHAERESGWGVRMRCPSRSADGKGPESARFNEVRHGRLNSVIAKGRSIVRSGIVNAEALGAALVALDAVLVVLGEAVLGALPLLLEELLRLVRLTTEGHEVGGLRGVG